MDNLYKNTDGDVSIEGMNTITMSPKVVGALQGIGLAVLLAVLAWLANATNLSGLVNPEAGTLVAMVALAIENSIESKTGNSLMGIVKSR